MIETQQPWGGGGPPGGGGGGYGGPPGGGGGYGGPPGGGGYGGPPGGGYGGPPPGGGYGGPPGGGYGGPPGGGFGGPPAYTPQVPGQSPGGGQKTDTMALVSLIAGLVSLPSMFCCSFFGVPISLCAIILGFIGISQVNKNPQQLTGKGMAIAGIITGSIGIVLLVVLLVVGIGGAILQELF